MIHEEYAKRQRYLEKTHDALEQVGTILHLEQSKLLDLRLAVSELETLQDTRTGNAIGMLNRIIKAQEQAVNKAKRERSSLEKLRDKIVNALHEMESESGCILDYSESKQTQLLRQTEVKGKETVETSQSAC